MGYRLKVRASLRRLLRPLVLLALVLFSLGPAVTRLAGQPSMVPRSDFWVPDGPVRDIAIANGIIYAGGSFGMISPSALKGSLLDLVSGVPAQDFPQADGAIYAVMQDG